MYNNQRISKKKTHVKKRTLNPVFNESFVFDLPRNESGLGKVKIIVELFFKLSSVNWAKSQHGRINRGIGSSGNKFSNFTEIIISYFLKVKLCIIVI